MSKKCDNKFCECCEDYKIFRWAVYIAAVIFAIVQVKITN